jgi:hypothetical protein
MRQNASRFPMALALLLAAVAAHAQAPWLTFRRDLDPRAVVSALAPLDGGGWIAAGRERDTALVERAVLWRLDAQGGTVWKGAWAPRGSARFRDLLLLDGGILAVGAQSAADGSAARPWILRASLDGDSLWTREPPIGDPGEFFAVSPRPSGFWCAGRGAAPGDLPDALLAAFAPDGALDWVRYYGSPSLEQTFDLAPLPDGGALLAGAFFDGTVDKVYAVRATAAGNPAWTRSYTHGQNDFALAAEATADGGAVMAGSGRFAGNDEGVLLSVDGFGVPRWEARFGGAGSDRFSALAALDGGDWLAAGRLDTAGGTAAWMLRTDSLGAPRWSRVDATSGGAWEAALPGADGALLLGGESAEGGLVMRFGPQGLFCGQPAATAWTPSGEGVLLQWEAVPGATRYALRWRAEGWTEDSLRWTPLLAEGLSPVPEGPRYDWSVTAWCGEDHYGLPATDSLRLLLGGLPDSAAPAAWRLVPNPARERAVVLGAEGRRWALLSPSGRTLATGRAGEPILLRGRAAGAYTVRLDDGSRQRLVVP